MNGFLRVALAVARKDLRTELRSREMLPALGQFVVLALLIANFGFDVGSGGTRQRRSPPSDRRDRGGKAGSRPTHGSALASGKRG